MITALSTYKDMIEASLSGNAGQQLQKAGSAGSAASSSELTGKLAAGSTDAGFVDISASHDVFTAVDSYFNLSSSGRFDDFHKLSPDDKEQFVRIVGELAKLGYVGYEEFVVDHKVERHEILNQMGDQRLRGAKLYDASKHRIR
jgi:hypothetical protein